MRYFFIALLVLAVDASIPESSAHAQEVDKFGQAISAELQDKVAQARRMRLKYHRDEYDPKASVALLESVVKEKPDYFRAHFNLGLSHHVVGNYSKAKESFDNALKIRELEDIDDFTVVNSAGWVSLRHGDFMRAERLLKEAEILSKNTQSFTERAVVSNLGELYFLTQRFDESKAYFEISRDKYENQSAQYYLDIIDDVQNKGE